MKGILLLTAFTIIILGKETIYNFTKLSASSDWRIVDDVVMGGRSSGNFSISANGNGIFSGYVSLENNGGFSSVRHKMKPMNISHATYFVLRVKGDGKNYQLRVKDNVNHYYSYKNEFSTSGEWQVIKLKMKDFLPTFRGRILDKASFSGEVLEEMTFLISNKKKESFHLEIDEITIE